MEPQETPKNRRKQNPPQAEPPAAAPAVAEESACPPGEKTAPAKAALPMDETAKAAPAEESTPGGDEAEENTPEKALPEDAAEAAFAGKAFAAEAGSEELPAPDKEKEEEGLPADQPENQAGEEVENQPADQPEENTEKQAPVPGHTADHTIPNPNDRPLDLPTFLTAPLPRLSPETAAALERKKKASKKTTTVALPTPPAKPETPPAAQRFDPLPQPLPSKRKYYKELKQQKQRKMLAIWLPIALLTVLVLLWGVWRMVGPSENGKGYPPYTIAIDPGHGGDDTGAIGFYTESQVTWATAQQLYALLDADSRFRPLLTKTESESLAPSERARVANKKNADLLLSIHCNSASADAVGFECYPPPPGWKYNEESLEFAGLLGQEMGALGATLRGTEGVRYLYYVNGEKTLRELGSDPLQGADTFSVLENTGCPAVLVEQCFLTNQRDAEAFAGQSGRQRSARAYYRAICAYYGLEPMAES